MSVRSESIIENFIGAIKESKEKTSPYDSPAEVLRVEGDTVWVHIAGGVDETPVRRTVNCAKGDIVQIRVGGGDAWVVGNATSPPTDDAKAYEAINVAEIADYNAEKAKQSADQAEYEAQRAYQYADEAKTSAENATYYANSALTELGIVEDVVGTLNWITEHGTYKASTDTTVVGGKYYFTRTGSGTTQNPYVYNVVINPTGNPSANNYYELDSIDEAVSNYISSHLALTDAGLWVLNDNNSYKILLSSTGMKVYDSTGALVATFGESISFSSNRTQYIGNNNCYVAFNPANGGTLTIGGATIQMGNQTLEQVLGTKANSSDIPTNVSDLNNDSGYLTDVDVSATQTSTGVDITIGTDTVSLTNGSQGEKGDKGNTGVSITSVTPYYILATETPQKPTTNPPPAPPEGAMEYLYWSITQPVLNMEYTCYVSLLNVFSDNTFSYSDVSTLSEYEASKTVYEKATDIEGTVSSQTQTISSIEGDVSQLQTDTDDLTKEIEKITTPIQINSSADDPYIIIQVGTTSDSAYTKYEEDRISFYKKVDGQDIEVLYIDSTEEEGVIDINNARVRNSIRIGELEIIEHNGGIAVRRSE